MGVSCVERNRGLEWRSEASDRCRPHAISTVNDVQVVDSSACWSVDLSFSAVPFTIKDAFETEGVRTTSSHKPLERVARPTIA